MSRCGVGVRGTFTDTRNASSMQSRLACRKHLPAFIQVPATRPACCAAGAVTRWSDSKHSLKPAGTAVSSCHVDAASKAQPLSREAEAAWRRCDVRELLSIVVCCMRKSTMQMRCHYTSSASFNQTNAYLLSTLPETARQTV